MKTQKLSRLMSEWKTLIKSKNKKILFPDDGNYYKAEEYFNSDGFYPGYYTAEKKVLFIGREPREIWNDVDRVKQDLAWFQNTETIKSYSYWRRIFYLAYGVKTKGKINFNNLPPVDEIYSEMKNTGKYNFAIMNISKYANFSSRGGTANWKLIGEFLFDSDLNKRNFCREEIELLEPDLIITANLWNRNKISKYLDIIFPVKDCTFVTQVDNKAFLWKFKLGDRSIYIIDVYHFSCPGSDEHMFYTPVMKLLQKIW